MHAPGLVGPSGFGRDGRFEKFILALQALTLEAPAAASRTDRVERMRAAAEELFGIDGLPQPIRPMAGPAAETRPADPATGAERETATASASDATTASAASAAGGVEAPATPVAADGAGPADPAPSPGPEIAQGVASAGSAPKL